MKHYIIIILLTVTLKVHTNTSTQIGAKKKIGESHIETTNRELQKKSDAFRKTEEDFKDTPGIDDLIKQDSIKEENERALQKNDSIIKEEHQTKMNIEETHEADFISRMIGYLIGCVSIILGIIFWKWLLPIIKNKSNGN